MDFALNFIPCVSVQQVNGAQPLHWWNNLWLRSMIGMDIDVSQTTSFHWLLLSWLLVKFVFLFFPCIHRNLHKLSPLYLLHTFLLNQITRTIMIMNASHTLGYVFSHLFWYLFNKIINYVMTVWLFVDSFNASIQVHAMRAFHTRYLVSNRFESITPIWFICVDSMLANTFCPKQILLWIDQCPLFVPMRCTFGSYMDSAKCFSGYHAVNCFSFRQKIFRLFEILFVKFR